MSDKKVKEPESISNKKAAKAVSGKTKDEGKAVKSAKQTGAKKETIGAMSIRLLKSGKGASETLAAVQKANPGCKTSINCIYWYANQNGIKLQKAAAKKAA